MEGGLTRPPPSGHDPKTRPRCGRCRLLVGYLQKRLQVWDASHLCRQRRLFRKPTVYGFEGCCADCVRGLHSYIEGIPRGLTEDERAYHLPPNAYGRRHRGDSW